MNCTSFVLHFGKASSENDKTNKRNVCICDSKAIYARQNKYGLNNGYKCDMGFNIVSAALIYKVFYSALVAPPYKRHECLNVASARIRLVM